MFPIFNNLIIAGYSQLLNLVPSSIAESMVQLTTMSVTHCDNLATLIANDGMTKEIMFSKLRTLELINLERLGSFCSGSDALILPSLEQVTVINCPSLWIFSSRHLYTSKLVSVKFSGEKPNAEASLNTIIYQMVCYILICLFE